MDIVDGKPKEKYEVKDCPIIINSYYNQSKTELEIVSFAFRISKSD